MSAPLTLAEVREIAEAKRNGYWNSRDIGSLCATIEWLAERIGTANLDCVGPDGEWCPYYKHSEDGDCGRECFEAEEELEA